jgi:hypothetical protein
MFLKRLERRKNGKKHTYWALVESYRTVRFLQQVHTGGAVGALHGLPGSVT